VKRGVKILLVSIVVGAMLTIFTIGCSQSTGKGVGTGNQYGSSYGTGNGENSGNHGIVNGNQGIGVGNQGNSGNSQDDHSAGQQRSQASNATILSSSYQSLSDEEIQSLLYMSEEEKLARDIYAYLYGTWGIQSFKNIQESEQTHMDSVNSIIDKYDLASASEVEAVGEFANADLQKLYDDLTAQGSISKIEALKVGAAIEEIDILDLQSYLTKVDDVDIDNVYGNLLSGSESHLTAFVSQLESYEVVYTPQYLSDEAYANIISGTQTQTGGNGGQNGNQGNGNMGGRGS
jgi:hypothetical protein